MEVFCDDDYCHDNEFSSLFRNTVLCMAYVRVGLAELGVCVSEICRYVLRKRMCLWFRHDVMQLYIKRFREKAFTFSRKRYGRIRPQALA